MVAKKPKRTVKKKTTKRKRCVYRKNIPDKMLAFFDRDPFFERQIEHYKKDELAWVDIQRVANKLPTLRDFAREIKVSRKTLYNWMNPKHRNYHKEMEEAYLICRDLRKEFMIQNGLLGLYNPLSFKFVACNMTDMVDKKAVDNNLGGQPNNPLPKLEIVIKRVPLDG